MSNPTAQTVEIPTAVTGPVDPATSTGEQITPPEQASPSQTPPQQDTPGQEAASEVLAEQGLNISSFEQEYEASGGLSDASYTQLEKAGLSREMVDRYIAGQESLRQGFVGEVQGLAGGESNYTAMTEWAKANLSPEEVHAYNTIMSGHDKNAIKLAVSGLAARWQKVEGADPRLVGGRAGAASPPRDVFESTMQVREAMRDQRYGKDRAYTRAVEDKMARSNVFG